jgi:hypothetical protein
LVFDGGLTVLGEISNVSLNGFLFEKTLSAPETISYRQGYLNLSDGRKDQILIPVEIAWDSGEFLGARIMKNFDTYLRLFSGQVFGNLY